MSRCLRLRVVTFFPSRTLFDFFFFFFFKQKTAYEMSIGDWSSDVSSDLPQLGQHDGVGQSIRDLRKAGAEVGGHERSEERRVGKECQSTCRSRWSRYH